jgi:O-antigen ligase
MKHPITGLGLCGWWSTIQRNYSDFSPGGPHSTFVQLYSDCGILGLIALGVAVYAGIILCRKNWHARGGNPNYGLFIGLVAGCIVMVALAFIENIFVVLIPLGDKNVCFTVPLIAL